jgi:hypothetical protein
MILPGILHEGSIDIMPEQSTKTRFAVDSRRKLVILSIVSCGTYLLYHAIKSAPSAHLNANEAFVAWHVGTGSPWVWVRARWRAVIYTFIAVETGVMMYLGAASLLMNNQIQKHMSQKPGHGMPVWMFVLLFLPFFTAQIGSIGLVVTHMAITARMIAVAGWTAVLKRFRKG